jgi:pimeloyl-ACP methyl ester carboxylesterase
MQEKIAGGVLAAVEGGGHMAPAEQPEVVAEALEAWLTTAPRG